MVPFSIILWASFTHERPPFRAAGLAPAARYASALRAVCQELRGRTGLALLGKHAVIGHELFACFDLDGDGFLDLRNGEKVGFRKISMLAGGFFLLVLGGLAGSKAPEVEHQRGMLVLLDLIANFVNMPEEIAALKMICSFVMMGSSLRLSLSLL